MKKNDGVYFYQSIIETIRKMAGGDMAKAGEAFFAVVDYALYDKEYEGGDLVAEVSLINARPLIDKANKDCENGKTGGRGHKKSETKKSEKIKGGLKKDKGGFKNSETYQDIDIDRDIDIDKDVDEDIDKDIYTSGIASNSSSNPKSDAAVAESRKSKLEDVTLADSIIDLYNRRVAETGCRLRSCVAKSQKRRGMVLARLREHGEENVRAVIEKAVASHFLNYGTRNGEPMDIEWIFGRDNFPKVLEGKYDDRPAGAPPKMAELIESPFDDISDEDWTAMGGERRLATIHERCDNN